MLRIPCRSRNLLPMRGDDEATGVGPAATDPTEFVDVLAAQTEVAYAWAADDAEDDPPSGWLTPRRITALGVTASLIVIAAAGAVALLHLKQDKTEPGTQSPSAAAQPSVTHQPPAAIPTAPMTPTPPPLPVLEGIDGQFVDEMRGYGVPVSDQDPQWTVNLARAVCSTVRDGGPHRYPPGFLTVRNLTDGVMEIIRTSAATAGRTRIGSP